MSESLEAGLKHEVIEGTPKIEEAMQKSASEKLNDAQTSTTENENISQQKEPGQSSERNIGLFGTLGLAWLHMSNKEIGGDEINFSGSPILLGAKDMDDVLITNMLEAGAELDKKYVGNNISSPELKFGLSMGMFYMIKGRLSRVQAWLKTHRKKDGADSGT